ncbi:Gfo/Idh/MocA family oxidoreductase [Vibrio gangliei]|uniref:Gfo/Idh/MocA family oxidoreductase n=1 Tax=Vibrio gangliei TaxID=2077090 RepID=UPI000D01BE7C|nr:Gfo/Idh/MocA family oxidoreductase [Vibrio gangliei]
MMKLGFIGFGKSTNRYHMPFIDAANKFEVTGYYTRGTRQFEMLYPNLNGEIQRFDDVQSLLASPVELIVITTPASSHYSYAKQAIEAGKHVIVEKPFCDTVEQAKELFQLAKQRNVRITPYQNRRYDSDFLTIKNLLARQDIGKVMEIESNHTHYRTDGANQRGNQYDGSVYGHAVHFLDQIVSLYGEPDDVIYDIANQKNYYIGEGLSYQMTNEAETSIPEDHYDIKLVYGNLRIRVRFSQLIVKEPPRWIVNATNATVEKYQIDQQERDLKQGIFLDNPNFGQDTAQGTCTIYFHDHHELIAPIHQHYTQFYLDTYQAIREGTEMPVTEQQALIVMNIMETIVSGRLYQKLN